MKNYHEFELKGYKLVCVNLTLMCDKIMSKRIFFYTSNMRRGVFLTHINNVSWRFKPERTGLQVKIIFYWTILASKHLKNTVF